MKIKELLPWKVYPFTLRKSGNANFSWISFSLCLIEACDIKSCLKEASDIYKTYAVNVQILRLNTKYQSTIELLKLFTYM